MISFESKLRFSIVVVLISAISLYAEAQNIIVVSVNGNDQNGNGTEARPYASLQKAKEIARNSKGSDEVVLHTGTYYQTPTLLFTPDDSNITFKAAKGEKVIISGGVEIKGNWKKEGHLLVTQLPKPLRYYFKKLYVGGRSRQRARYPDFNPEEPNQVLYRNGIGEPSDSSFRFKPGDIRKFQNLGDVMVNYYHLWVASQHYLIDVDEKNNNAVFRPRTFFNAAKHPYWLDPKGRYYLENAKEFLTSPGEWYLDRQTAKLYYIPLPGETAENLCMIAPLVSKLVQLAGTPDKPVRNVHFEGMALMHTDWDENIVVSGQSHDMYKVAMIFGEFAENCSFQDLTVTCGGAHGIMLSDGCNGNIVRKCHVFHMGGGGVYVGKMGNWCVSFDYLPERNIVDNCLVHDLAHFFHGSYGINITNSSYNRVTHNEVFDTDGIAISIGQCWDMNEPSKNHHNLIQKNYVHHVGRGELSDMALIYTLGYAPGTELSDNVAHDIATYTGAGYGLYLDDGTKNLTAKRNLIFNIQNKAVFLKDGPNQVYDNIFAYPEKTGITTWDVHPVNGGTFERNIMLFHKAETGKCDLVQDALAGKGIVIGHNIYWDVKAPEKLRFGGKSFKDWQASSGYDSTSLLTDPQFIVPFPSKVEDFRLKPGSPAEKLCMDKTVDHRDVGLYGEKEWVDLPTKYAPMYPKVYKKLGVNQ